MSTKSSTPEGKDSAPINDSSGEVIFNPQHHSSQHPLYVDNDLEVSPSKNPKGAYDAEGDGPLHKGDNSIIIQELLSLRQTLQQEIRNVCSETTEICYDIQHRLGRDVAELRSDLENQLSCLKNRFTQLENQNLNNYNTRSTEVRFTNISNSHESPTNKIMTESQQLQTGVQSSTPTNPPSGSSTHNARGRTLTIPSDTFVQTGGVPLPINNPTMVCNSRGTIHTKPQLYDGSEDLEEYLAQFQIISDINGWDYKTKSLHLAGSLNGSARSILSELNETERRDYNTIVRSLNTRYGSVERAEIFRAKLQTRIRGREETIPELAQAIRKLTRQAYPSAPADITDILGIDHFIDALPDFDMRLKLRESHPRTISDAELQAIRLETLKLADRQRGRQVRNLQHHTEPENQKGTLSTPSDGSTVKLQDEICKTIKTEFSNVRGDLHSVTSELKQVVQSLKSVSTPRAPVSNNYRDYNNQNRNGRGNFSNQPYQQRNQYRGFQDTRSRQQNSTQDTPINGNPQSVQNNTRGNGRMSNLGARERHQM